MAQPPARLARRSAYDDWLPPARYGSTSSWTPSLRNRRRIVGGSDGRSRGLYGRICPLSDRPVGELHVMIAPGVLGGDAIFPTDGVARRFALVSATTAGMAHAGMPVPAGARGGWDAGVARSLLASPV